MYLIENLWPYAAIVATLFFTGIGLPPLPEEAGIAAAAIAAMHPEIHWWLAWPACIAGILGADLVLYAAGRLGRERLFHLRPIRGLLSDDQRSRIEAGFHRHGVWILLTARLLPGLRTAVFMVAGAARFPFARFILADGVFAVFGVGFFFFGTYFFAEAFRRWLQGVHEAQNWLMVLLLPSLLMVLAYRLIRYWRTRDVEKELEPPLLNRLPHLGHMSDRQTEDDQKTVPLSQSKALQ
ncbi:MAG: hypothetical protein C4297_10285 [Gemmataceae bacterium]